GKLKAVWLCAPSQTSWAVLHVVKRHGGRVEDTVVLESDVPRRWLRRSRKRLWSCRRDIPPDCIRRLLTFRQLAGSSAPLARPAGATPLGRDAYPAGSRTSGNRRARNGKARRRAAGQIFTFSSSSLRLSRKPLTSFFLAARFSSVTAARLLSTMQRLLSFAMVSPAPPLNLPAFMSLRTQPLSVPPPVFLKSAAFWMELSRRYASDRFSFASWRRSRASLSSSNSSSRLPAALTTSLR